MGSAWSTQSPEIEETIIDDGSKQSSVSCHKLFLLRHAVMYAESRIREFQLWDEFEMESVDVF